MPKDFNERGEIINTPSPSRGSNPTPMRYGAQEERGTYMAVTLVGSPVIYSIVGLMLNSWLEWYLAPGVALLIGAGFGILVTGIYNATSAKEYSAKEYAMGLGLPGLILAAVGLGLIIIGVIIVLGVLAALLGGG